MRFLKGHGTGNDFVLLPDADAQLSLPDGVVQAVCDRHFGVGADGVLRVVPTEAVAEVAHLAGDAQWFMDYRNADGTAVEMCGNGIRVFARYLYDAGLVTGEHVAIATRDGIKSVTRRDAQTYAVDMGPPVIGDPASISIEVDGAKYDVTDVSMGNPHAVLFVDDVPGSPVRELGPRIETLAVFPRGTNVEFVAVAGRGLTMRVWERGVGETMSCGTGACAAAVASAYAGHTGRTVDVDVPGGRLQIDWTEAGPVTLTGPAIFVASGEFDAGWLAGQAARSVR
ncbi:MAG: diaminopimelate epimerase [Mycobacteriales bacterium]